MYKNSQGLLKNKSRYNLLKKSLTLQMKIGKAISRKIPICLLCFYSLSSSVFYCLLSLWISPGSAGPLVWSIADILVLLEHYALHAVSQFHLGIGRHWTLQFSIFPRNHSTKNVSLKLLVFCCAQNENKTREK